MTNKEILMLGKCSIKNCGRLAILRTKKGEPRCYTHRDYKPKSPIGSNITNRSVGVIGRREQRKNYLLSKKVQIGV